MGKSLLGSVVPLFWVPNIQKKGVDNWARVSIPKDKITSPMRRDMLRIITPAVHEFRGEAVSEIVKMQIFPSCCLPRLHPCPFEIMEGQQRLCMSGGRGIAS